MPRRLTNEQVASFKRNGVLFPIAVLSPDQVVEYRTQFEEIYRRLGKAPPSEKFGQWPLCFRWAYDLATHPAVLDAVEGLLGPNILVHSSTVFQKPTGSACFVSWHQDGHNWGLDAPQLVSAWIALSDSTPENGCLRVIPGSHQSSHVAHRAVPHPDNLLITGLQIAIDIDEQQAVDVCLRAGEMSIHHVDIVHGSNANRSASSRIGFAIRYVRPQVRQTRWHHRVILARGEDRYHYFELLEAPPDNTIERGIAAQADLVRERHSAKER